MPKHSRKSRRRQMSLRAYLGSIRKGHVIAAGIVVLLVIAAVAAIAATRQPSPSKGSKSATSRRVTEPALPVTKCPLTDLPAPGGVAPHREALAVKIGNEPAARPQSGLEEADIVYDTPAEGGIQRYIAVFQCYDSPVVGPIRSVRWVDWHILAVFHHVELAYAGGVQPNQDTVASKRFIDNANEFVHYSAFHQNPARTMPDATYASTEALWHLFPPRRAPRPIFTYTASLPSGAKTASTLEIDFSAGTDVVWKWNPSMGVWDHTYAGVPDTDALNGQPVSTTNIVVQIVNYTIGPYIESIGGSGDIQSQTVGTGKGWVLRNGEEIPVIWHRAALDAPTTFTSLRGQPVGLQPGRTWVEIVLNTTAKIPGAITITP